MARPLGDFPFSHDIRSGIYRIVNTATGAVYFGSALNFYRRWRRHHNELKKRIHPNSHLQRAWDKYGSEAFRWEVVEVVEEKEEIIRREQYWLDKLFAETTRDARYNTCVVAGSHIGVKRSEETKKKMSDKAKARGNNNVAENKVWIEAMQEVWRQRKKR